MGDRVSIQFQNGKDLSPVLFSHWGGMEFVKEAKDYAKNLKQEVGNRTLMPLDRMEPRTVIVDFIRHISRPYIAEGKRINSDLYLGATETDGDNSDNGHHIIKLKS